MNQKGIGEKAVSTKLSGCKTAGRFIYFSCHLVFQLGEIAYIYHTELTQLSTGCYFCTTVFSLIGCYRRGIFCESGDLRRHEFSAKFTPT